jgi:hypothetical protein
MVYEDVLATKDIVDRRTVELERSEEKSLGIAIQGGLDFKLPVSIDTIFEDSPASRSGVIEREDVLLEVGGQLMWGRTHEEAVELLRTAGQTVTLTVAKLVDKDDLGEGEGGGGEDFWIPYTCVPLRLATVSCYAHSTAMIRPNTLQVVSCDERSKVTLHCDERGRGQLEEWLAAIRLSTSLLLTQELNAVNDVREEDDQLVLMGWAHELLSSTPHTKVWRRKFLALKKSEILIYDIYPKDVHEWSRPSHTHKLTEVTCRVLKPHELENQRADCLLLSSGRGYSHLLSFETRQALSQWSQALHRLSLSLTSLLQVVRFPGQWKGNDVDFCIDLQQGFVIRERGSTEVKWARPFSWLRASSDDNHSWLRLVFARPRADHTETQEIELGDLHLALVAMESFMLAKVMTLDPSYVSQTDFIAEPSP